MVYNVPERSLVNLTEIGTSSGCGYTVIYLLNNSVPERIVKKKLILKKNQQMTIA